MFQKTKYLKAFAVIAVLAVSLIPMVTSDATFEGVPQEPQPQTVEMVKVAGGPVEDAMALIDDICRPIC